MNKQPEVTAATRQKLVDAFWELYEAKPLNSIRIREITDIAGYNRATFYQYFLDIYDLASSEVDRIIAMAKSFDSVNQIRKQPEDFLDHVMGFFRQEADHISLLIDRGDTDYISREKEEIFKIITESFLIEGSAETEIVRDFFVYGLMHALSQWHKTRKEVSEKEFLETMYSILSTGLLSYLERSAGNRRH